MKKNHFKPVSERRDFLKQIATGAVVTLGALASPIPLTASPSLPFMLDNDDPDAWFNKLNGKHKIVYDVPEAKGMMPFAWARVFLLTNAKTGTPEKESNVVIILRHDGIPYAMENRLWEKYKFGEMFKINDEKTKAPATQNMFWQPKPGAFS
nr:twin-arginine translocation signal domain-containing protein [Bacteroidota bacterium]